MKETQFITKMINLKIYFKANGSHITEKVKQKGPVTFIIKNQLDGTTIKTHAEHLRLANVDEWDIPKTKSGRSLRRAAFVMPQHESGTDDRDSSVDESDGETPLSKLPNRYRKERDNSSDESDIPLMELSK